MCQALGRNRSQDHNGVCHRSKVADKQLIDADSSLHHRWDAAWCLNPDRRALESDFASMGLPDIPGPPPTRNAIPLCTRSSATRHLWRSCSPAAEGCRDLRLKLWLHYYSSAADSTLQHGCCFITSPLQHYEFVVHSLEGTTSQHYYLITRHT